MDNRDLSLLEKLERQKRRKEAMKIMEIEGKPFTKEAIAFFDEMDELGLNDEERLQRIKQKFSHASNTTSE